VIHTNSQGSITLIKNLVHHNITKHIDIQHHYVRDVVVVREVLFVYCSTMNMWDDILTKGLLSPKHLLCTETLKLGKLKMWLSGSVIIVTLIMQSNLSYLCPRFLWLHMFRFECSLFPFIFMLNFTSSSLLILDLLFSIFIINNLFLHIYSFIIFNFPCV